MKINSTFKIVVYLIVFTITSCKKEADFPPINDTVDLDGTIINDSSLTNPANYLLSARITTPSNTDKSTPVLIAAHGFSASTFEWLEFRDWAKSNSTIYTSLVLLGGHGRDYIDFKNASWQNWQTPIIEEYNKLRNLGYTNISIIASSTGCPLVLEMLRNNKINVDVLKHVFFIDPIIVPSNKTLSAIPVLGPALNFVETELAIGENGFWYKYRPQEALKELEKLTRQERKALEKGVNLEGNYSLKIFKAKQDDAADPISAVILNNGLRFKNGQAIAIQMMSTDLHVFTRLKGRDVINTEQRNLQVNTFQEINNTIQ